MALKHLIAYKYMLIKLASKFIKNNFEWKDEYLNPNASLATTIKFFNHSEDNNFNIKKCQLMPFAISVANGEESRKTMLKFFGEYFEPTELGIIHTNINKYILSLYKSRWEDNLIKFKANPKDGEPVLELNTTIIEGLDANNGEFYENIYINLVNSFVYKENNNAPVDNDNVGFFRTEIDNVDINEIIPVFKTIDVCIEYIEKIIQWFVNYDDQYMSFITKDNRAYVIYDRVKSQFGIDADDLNNFRKDIFLDFAAG